MRHVLTLTAASAAVICLTIAASAQSPHPRTIFCLVSGGDASSRNCSYATVEACNAARVGAGGTCVAYTLPPQ